MRVEDGCSCRSLHALMDIFFNRSIVVARTCSNFIVAISYQSLSYCLRLKSKMAMKKTKRTDQQSCFFHQIVLDN